MSLRSRDSPCLLLLKVHASVDGKLNSFKKGAFHISMQAKVPVVPIVIHNAMDVCPKGDLIFHPGKVFVTVLPPIDTSTWKTDCLDEKVAKVRKQFLDVLDSPL